MTANRRLAAIMFTDMVGYTRLAQSDETAALRLLSEQLELLREVLPAFGGKEIKTMGDGALIEFPSAVEATKCAWAIQARVRARNAARSGTLPILLRIGVHVGEVVGSGQDILGDAVNVASRIEPLAEPGGILISEPVYQIVRNKLPAAWVSRGRRSLKNVEAPLELYQAVSDTPAEPALAPSPRPFAPLSPVSQRIVVLPMTNLSSPSDEYFSDGLTEELTSTIGRASGLKVISRTSAARYKNTDKGLPEIGRELQVGTVLEGSVRRSGDRVRVSVQLIDVTSDEQVWSRIYERDHEDVFVIQTNIAESVAQALKVQILPQERQLIESRPTNSVGAHDFYLQGRYHWHKGTEADLRTAIRLFEKAIEVDPTYAQAYVGLADSHIGLCDEGCADPGATFRTAQPLVAKALELDDHLPEAHATMARLVQDYLRNWEEAEKEFRRAIELHPNWAIVCNSYAVHLAKRGRLEQAVTEIQRAEILDPYSLGVHDCAAAIYRGALDYEASIRECRWMLEIDPNFVPAYTKLGMALLQTSRFEEGVAAMEKAREISHGGLLATSYVAYAYGLVGRSEEALELIHELERGSEERFVSPYNVAIGYAGLQDRDATLSWLRKAYEIKASTLGAIHVDPTFEFLQGDPEFQELKGALGLSASTPGRPAAATTKAG